MIRWILIVVIVALIVIGAGSGEGLAVVGGALLSFFGGMWLADAIQRRSNGPRVSRVAEVIGWGTAGLAVILLLYGVWAIWLPMMLGGG